MSLKEQNMCIDIMKNTSEPGTTADKVYVACHCENWDLAPGKSPELGALFKTGLRAGITTMLHMIEGFMCQLDTSSKGMYISLFSAILSAECTL